MKAIEILFENDEIFVINKPSGLACQGGEGVRHSLDKDFALQVQKPVFLVHRLDKETSGIMILAKSAKMATKWTRLISEKVVKKTYTAICIGKMNQKNGTINETIEQHGEKKTAVTHYEVVAEKEIAIADDTDDAQSDAKLTLSKIRLTLETGRMHQIRIHLAKNFCPIAGDDKHGNFRLNKILKKQFGIKTLQLASTELVVSAQRPPLSFSIAEDQTHLFPFERL